MTATYHRSRLGRNGGYFSHESRGDNPHNKKNTRRGTCQAGTRSEEAGEGEEQVGLMGSPARSVISAESNGDGKLRKVQKGNMDDENTTK